MRGREAMRKMAYIRACDKWLNEEERLAFYSTGRRFPSLIGRGSRVNPGKPCWMKLLDAPRLRPTRASGED
jgi:hypothetical protein